MCQRQEGHHAVAREEQVLRRVAGSVGMVAENGVGSQRTAGGHHPLRETRGAGRVVDGSQLLVVLVVVADAVGIELPLELRIEKLLDGLGRNNLAGKLKTGAGLLVNHGQRTLYDRQRTIVGEGKDRAHLTELVLVKVIPIIVAGKQQLRIRVLDDVVDVFGAEVLENRHDDRAVCDGGDIGDSPAGAVLADEGDAVVFLDAALLEQQVQFLDLLGHLAVCKREFCLIIGEGLQVPIAAERVLKHAHKVLFNHCLKCD